MCHRYKRSKFQPDASNQDLLHIFEIQSESIGRSAMAVASLKRPFWYRRSLHRKFTQAAAGESQVQPANESVQEHAAGSGLHPSTLPLPMFSPRFIAPHSCAQNLPPAKVLQKPKSQRALSPSTCHRSTGQFCCPCAYVQIGCRFSLSTRTSTVMHFDLLYAVFII